MNRPEELDEDILSRFISPENIEKAPVGFTQRTLIKLQSEKNPYANRQKSLNKYFIPVVSVLISFAFIISALLLSSSNDYIPDLSFLKSRVSLSMSEFNIDKIFSSPLPALVIYIFLGIFLLLLFDQLFNRFFHRERK